MKLKAGELEKLAGSRKIITPEEARRSKPEPERRMRFPKLSAFAIALLASISAMKEKNARADEPANPPAAVQPVEAQPSQPELPAEEPNPYRRPEDAPANQDNIPYAGQENAQAPESRLFFTNLESQPMGLPRSTYDDPYSQLFSPAQISPRASEIPGNDWDMGGALISNEAGTGIRAHASYRDLVSIIGGNMWLNGLAVPFGGILVSLEANIWRFSFRYFGTLNGAGNLPSYLFSAHTASFRFSFPFRLDSADESRTLKLNFGMSGGGAFDYPNFIDYHFNMVPGLSLRLTGYPDSGFSYLIYGQATFPFCAPTPPETAYIGRFQPFFQHAEAGFSARIFQDFTLGAFAQFGGFDNVYAFRGSWDWSVDNLVRGILFLELGADHRTGPFEEVFGPFLAIGARITYGGESMNSTNTSSYSNRGNFNLQDGTTEPRDPSIYGFGRSGDPSWDVPINQAKSRILSSSGFDDFASSYAGASFDEKLKVAQFLTAFLGQVAYANGVPEALFSGDILNPELERVASASLDDIMGWMRAYISWYGSNPPGSPMPDELKGGIAVCAGIHWLAAKFFAENGIPAAAVGGINTHGGPHVVTVVRHGGEYILIDYGRVYRNPDYWSLIRQYGMERGIPTFRMYLFGPDFFDGVALTPEGRLMEAVIGLDNEQITRGWVLGAE